MREAAARRCWTVVGKTAPLFGGQRGQNRRPLIVLQEFIRLPEGFYKWQAA